MARGRGNASNAQEESSSPRRSPPRPMAADLDILLRGLERIARNALEMERRPLEEERRPRENDFFDLYRSFSSLCPPTFDGNEDFLAAENWLAGIENKFQLLRAPEENQVELATQFLEGHARFWWQETKRRYIGDLQRVPWVWFKEQFEGRYLDLLSRENLRQKFVNLKQGGGTVAEYNSKFENLMRYAPDIANDNFRLRQQYLRGLNPHLAQLVDLPGIILLPELMLRAATAESYDDRIKKEGNTRNVKPRIETSRVEIPEAGNDEVKEGWCRFHRLPHSESQCRVLTGKCFNCKEVGHLARNCPKPQQQGADRGTTVLANTRIMGPQQGGGHRINLTPHGGPTRGRTGVHHYCCTHATEQEGLEENIEGNENVAEPAPQEDGAVGP